MQTTERHQTRVPLGMGPSPYLEISGLSKTYEGQVSASVVDVSIDLQEGEFLTLLGPSGCGKTTTLRMIAGLITPSAGRISVGGNEITSVPVHRRRMGVVFQSYALFPHLNVQRNVAFGLEMQKVPKAEIAQRVHAALELVDLAAFANRRVKEISGGQQQRVALARALVIEPFLLLLDEPLSNLDAKLRERMRTEIRAIQQRSGVTTIFVTHDQDEALSMSDKIAVMNQGTVVQFGTPTEVYERPSDDFVAGFVGHANILNGTVVAMRSGIVEVEIPGIGRVNAAGQASISETVKVLIRPHRVLIMESGSGTVASNGTRLTGTISGRSYTGDVITYTVAVGTKRLVIDVPTGLDTPLGPGNNVTLGWSPDDARLMHSNNAGTSGAS